jgi:alkaline phosphatase
MGLDHTAEVDSCEDQKTKQVTTLWELAETIGMSTGAVTTATITHATPGAAYAHIASREWESDAAMPAEAIAAGCADIARQLVEMRYGDGLEVAMGGGRANFLPTATADPEYQDKTGKRNDGKDLTKAWLDRYGDGGAYVWNKAQFDTVDPASVDHLLGLFEMSHMQYDYDRLKDKAGEPSLAEMADKAIDVLAKNPEGFVLMIEGGRIDHGSHASNAFRTLTDAVAMNEAVKTVLRKVNLDETLIVVTGDHSHTLTIAGYARRGNPILGISIGVDGEPALGTDGKAYTTIGFANGPGGLDLAKNPGGRPEVRMEEATGPEYIQQSLVPLSSETHGGEDLGIYAIGPWAHLFQGTVEENYTFHVMDFAAKISERAKAASQ